MPVEIVKETAPPSADRASGSATVGSFVSMMQAHAASSRSQPSPLNEEDRLRTMMLDVLEDWHRETTKGQPTEAERASHTNMLFNKVSNRMLKFFVALLVSAGGAMAAWAGSLAYKDDVTALVDPVKAQVTAQQAVITASASDTGDRLKALETAVANLASAQEKEERINAAERALAILEDEYEQRVRDWEAGRRKGPRPPRTEDHREAIAAYENITGLKIR